MTDNIALEHYRMQVNDIHLHVVQAGPVDGPLVILLHGFPEFWYGWQNQISALAAAGFRVWAPDQRGYNLSDRPRSVAAYNMDTLAADVLGLVDASGREKVRLVGHDWGGNVAWWFARLYPERLAKLAILNVPHGSVMEQHLRHNPAQQRKSWYIFFFQIPWLPETVVRRNNWRLSVQALLAISQPGTFSPDDIALYRQAWSQPGAMRAMINWYRAVVRFQPKMRAGRRIKVPTLVIWGAKDPFFARGTPQASVDLCDNGRLEMIETAGHWVQHEEPEQVNSFLIDHFNS